MVNRNSKAEIKDLNPQYKFLAQKSHAPTLLTATKSKQEYFEIIKWLLQSYSKSNDFILSSSSKSIISLEDENKDDCFGILPRIQ